MPFLCSGKAVDFLLGAFAKMLKAAIRFAKSVCLSVCLSVCQSVCLSV